MFRDIYETVLEIKEKAASIKLVKHDDNYNMGPLISKRQQDKVRII